MLNLQNTLETIFVYKVSCLHLLKIFNNQDSDDSKKMAFRQKSVGCTY